MWDWPGASKMAFEAQDEPTLRKRARYIVPLREINDAEGIDDGGSADGGGEPAKMPALRKMMLIE
jgi:hypothetical protein